MSIDKQLEQLSPEKQKLILKLLAEKQQKLNQANQIIRRTAGPPVLSFVQERFWFLNRLESENSMYNIAVTYRVKGKINFPAFEKSLNEIIRRHEVLRITFTEINGEPSIVVNPDLQLKIKVDNIQEFPEIERETRAKEIIAREVEKPFDLSKGPLIRHLILQINNEEYIGNLIFHHSIFDSYSSKVFLGELVALYEAFSNNRPSPLPDLPFQYSDYAAWHREWLQGERFETQLAFWKNQLSNLPLLQLPADKSRPPVKNTQGANGYCEIDPQMTRNLKEFCKQNEITPFVALMTTFCILLSRYSGMDDLIIGSPVSGRNRTEVESLIGCFINTLVLRVDLTGKPTLTELMDRVKQVVFNAYNHQDVPFEKLVNELQPERDMSYTPLFQVLMNFRKDQSQILQIQGTRIKYEEIETGTAAFDITLDITEYPDRLQCRFEYDTELFQVTTIQRIMKHFIHILGRTITNPQQKLVEIDCLSGEEKQQLLYDFNDTKAGYPREKTLQGLFEEQVERTPDNIAVVYEGRALSYRELNRKANQLARIIRSKGIHPDHTVGLIVDRSLEMIVGIMAVLKSGGAYLPIDPAYPEERIKYMLEDSGTQILITRDQDRAKADFPGEIIDLNDIGIYQGNDANLENITRPEHLAYIIYTSGTTGKPKGAMIEHRNVVRLMFNDRIQFDFSADDVWTMFHSYCFDFSVWEMYGALLYGGKLIVIPKLTAQNPKVYLKLLKDQKVTVLNQTPTAFFNLVNEEMQFPEAELRLRYVIFGGEALKPIILKPWFQKYPQTKLINMYGITETTVHVTFKEIGAADIELNISNIGKSIPTLTTYIFNKNMSLQPIGVPGELCVGGDGVGRGYLNRSELTREKFVENPYHAGETLYKSGDLARWLPDGNLEYLGRIDHQVKIRGHRIELGEIQNRLMQHPDIKDAVVIDGEETVAGGKQKYLCAYIIATSEITTSELREHMGRELPDYMIPSYFVRLEAMPLTSNGKVDRKALPKPDGSIASGQEYVAPVNDVEWQLVQIWQKVLGVEKIGTNDNFFELGGHSLKATVLVAEILKELKVSIPLKEIFKTSTIHELAGYIAAAEQSRYSAIQPVVEQDYYPVSAAQKRMYLLWQLESDAISYNIPSAFMIEGEVDKDLLESRFAMLIARHEILRTSFEKVDNEPVQRVHPAVDFGIEYLEFPTLEAGPGEILEFVGDFIRPFDLGQASLFRVKLIRLKGEKHLLLMDMYHIISDGVSLGVIINELSQLDHGRELPVLRIQYKDFAVWQNELFQSGAIKSQEDYWLGVFDGEIPVLNMPTDYPRPVVQSFAGSSINFEIESSFTEKLNLLAKETGATLYMLLLAAYNILLSKYCGQEDIIIGSPIAGRPHADLQNVIGMFVNTLAMRNFPAGDKTFRQFLAEVKENALLAYENQEYQFEELIEKLNLRRDISRNPLFDTVFVLQNMDSGSIKMGGLQFKPYSFENRIAKFDLTLQVAEHAKGISLMLDYCVKLFKPETVERIVKHYLQIIGEIVHNPEVKLSEIEMLSGKEKAQILTQFNDTRTDYPKIKTIQELFEEQVARIPGHTALVYKDQQLTYGELNEKANQLARCLKNKGVGADTIVGLMAERSFEMIIGIMAIFKAGGAYLPIDPEYPNERIHFMLEDSSARIILTQNLLAERIHFQGTMVQLEDPANYRHEGSNLKPQSKSDNLAYVIYTSGSTGKPKGNLTTHFNISRVVKNTNYITISDQDILLQLSNYSFDGSTFDIYGALLNGAKLVLVDKDSVLNIALLAEVIRKEKITVFFITTALFNTLVDLKIECLQGVRKILFGGERISVNHTRKALAYLGKHRLVHVYGPTETTVFATAYDINEIDESRETIPIGKPIANTGALILDSRNRLQPVGVAGELCITGDGLAKGYLSRPELTREKFVGSPFIPKEIMYRTGDLVRWLPDGNIEFLGRIDHQVKIRGFRIEPGEIERRLLEHEKIKEAVIIDRTDAHGNKYLCAYLVAQDELKAHELREYLLKELPNYMVPSYFIQLDKLPINLSGKVDRRALPEPDTSVSTGREYVAAANEVEETLVSIWQDVLGIEKIGTKDDFFELGGHSLKATVLVAKIHQKLNVNLSLKEIFKAPTIKELARFVNKAEKNLYSSIQPVQIREYYPVSSTQKRMYLLWKLEGDSAAYNVSGAAIIEDQIEKNQIENWFKALIARHEALRTSFEMANGEPVQRVHQTVDFTVDYLELPEIGVESESLRNIVGSFIRPFNLGHAPLLRVKLVRLKEAKQLLFLDMHHIVSDGVSLGVLLKELGELSQNRELPVPRIQYKDFAVWQNKFFGSEAIKSQEAYWLKVFNSEIPVLNMPTDYPRPTVQSFEGSTLVFDIDASVTYKLNQMAAETGSTMYMILLAAFNILLAKYTGQEDIIVGSPIAGRPQADLETIIGMFVNTLAMRNYPESGKTFRKFLAEVKEHAFMAYENQDYQFEELIEKLNLHRDISRNPLYDVVFVLQNMNLYQHSGLQFTPYELDNRVAKFDLTLTAVETGDIIRLSLEYCTKLFTKATAAGMIRHYLQIVAQITENPELTIAKIDCLSEEEKQQLLYGFNDTQAGYPREKTLQGLFEEQAKRNPDNIAVVFEGQQLSYRELNRKANQLARVIRSEGIHPDRCVGLIVDRSLEMIIGILAVLKSGGAYLPIDPGYPEERIKYMLEDSGTQILLIRHQVQTRVDFPGAIIDLDDAGIYQGNDANLDSVTRPEHLAYIIYTSGTTGNPKGAMIEHRNVVRLMLNDRIQFDFSADDVWTMFHSYCFDFSVWEMYGALLYGGKLIVIPRLTAQNPKAYLKLLKDQKVTVLNQTPTAFFNLINEEMHVPEAELRLRYVIFGGEALKPIILKPWFQKYPQTKLINMYGITETTVHVTFKEIGAADIELNISNIGKPIPTLTTYVFNKNMGLQPIGVPGELCVGGDGVGRGYLNRSELTKEKFVVNPYRANETLYRSGDLARWLTDGNLEYLGRIDHQVKIRGHRIELGEIQNRLLQHPGIKDAVVIDREELVGGENQKYLCAYIITTSGITTSELREHMGQELPDYMIPSYFVKLEKMPLTSNGKVDRKALPKPDGSIASGQEYVAPTNEIEAKLAEIWQDVLGVAKIGINDNFFELGGDSIRAIQVSARLNQYQLTIDLKDLFKNPTILQLAKYVKYEKIEISQEPVTGEISLTPVQRWFFESTQTDRHHFNQSVMLYRKEGFDKKIIYQVFDKLLEHHDALRMTYLVDKPHKHRIIQYNRGLTEGKLYELKVIDLTHDLNCETQVEAKANHFQREIDPVNGPLVKLGLFKTKDGDHLLIIIHHLVIDGVSWRILVEDLMASYQSVLQKKTIKFAPKTHSFKEWSHRLQQYSNSKEFLREKEYWRGLENQAVLPLFSNAPGAGKEGINRHSLSFKLSPVETEQLLKQVNTAYNTEINDILMTVLGLAVKQSTGQEKVLIQMEGHGREEIIPGMNITRTVGWFTSIYPVILDMAGASDISYAIKRTKECLRRVPHRGIGYGILKYLTWLENKQDVKFKLNPEICFNYLGQFDRNTQYQIFTTSKLPMGLQVSPKLTQLRSPLEITGMVMDNEMVLTFNFDTLRYQEANIAALLKNFRAILLDIIQHCTSKEESELTPSDFENEYLSIEELDSILKSIDKL